MSRTSPRKKHPGVAKAIAAAGTQQALALRLGTRQSAISKRLYGDVAVTAEWAVEVERALEGAVNRRDLVPGIWT